MNWPVVIWVLAVTVISAAALLIMAAMMVRAHRLESRIARLEQIEASKQ
jgi:hypothetical protein